MSFAPRTFTTGMPRAYRVNKEMVMRNYGLVPSGALAHEDFRLRRRSSQIEVMEPKMRSLNSSLKCETHSQSNAPPGGGSISVMSLATDRRRSHAQIFFHRRRFSGLLVGEARAFSFVVSTDAWRTATRNDDLFSDPGGHQISGTFRP